MSVEDPRPRTAKGAKIALIGAGLVAGAIGAAAYSASAQASSTAAASAGSTATVPGSSTASAPAGYPAGAPAGAGRVPNGSAPTGAPNPGGSKPVRSDEKAVDSATAATLKAAALKSVPGGTVIRVETDAGDGAYEAHVRKSDGTLVTVKFDKTLKVIKVESGMGLGDPAPAGRPGSH